MIVGYARTSTVEQKTGFDAQLKELETASCEKIFQEQVSSVAERLRLNAPLEFVRDGDTFVVTKTYRLARSITNLLVIIDALRKKKVALRILNLGMDTSTPAIKLMLTILGGISEFEREIMLERQREGIAKAKTENKYKGRKPLSSDRRNGIKLAGEGTARDTIAKQLRHCRGFRLPDSGGTQTVMKALLVIRLVTVTLCFALAGCAGESPNNAEMNRIDRDTNVAPDESAAPDDEAQQAVMNAREQRLQQNQPQ
jgi:DNA invertase Pin-like site-specific DNA recombinase